MKFDLAWHDRRLTMTPRITSDYVERQTPRRFLDYIVEGESLYERHGADFISPLGWFLPEEDEKAAQRLLGDEPPDIDGRVGVYVCPECGDRYCGALTVVLEQEGSEVVWSGIATSHFNYVHDAWTHDSTAFADWPDLRFDATEYRHAITERQRPS